MVCIGWLFYVARIGKNHSWILWGILSLVFGPIALIAVAGMPTLAVDGYEPEEDLGVDAQPWDPKTGAPN